MIIYIQPLDDFCQVVQKEIQMIVGHRIPSTDTWIFVPENRPIAPESELSAVELNDRNPREIQRLLSRRANITREIVFGDDWETELKAVTTIGNKGKGAKQKVAKYKNDAQQQQKLLSESTLTSKE